MDERPFNAFNFAVEISVPDVAEEVCEAAFSECDGLEMTLDVKSLREGGNLATQHRLAGFASYGQVTLRRGMTSTSFDLWKWFDAVVARPSLRADAEVVVLAPDGSTERARYALQRCLPVKLKAPPLNARDGVVAIEELQLVYDSLQVVPGDGGAGGGGLGIGFGASLGISISGGVGA